MIEMRDIRIIKKGSKFYNFLSPSQKTKYHKLIEQQYSLIEDPKNYTNKENIEWCVACLEDDFDKEEFLKAWEF